ncbi:MAG: hypothetical protein WBE37_05080 [Bryobacteraceae bacterium]
MASIVLGAIRSSWHRFREEGFVAADRPAHRSAEFVIAQRILGLAGLIGEKVGRVQQRIVAKEFEQRSVQIVRAGFRLQVNHAAGNVAVFGGVRPGLHRKLATVL